MTPDERQLRRMRIAKLRQIMEDDCKHPTAPKYNLKKKLEKYKVMDDEYYHWDVSKFMGTQKLADVHEMHVAGNQPGVGAELWELMAGSGRLSATARQQEVTHRPPLDYRWGSTLDTGGTS